MLPIRCLHCIQLHCKFRRLGEFTLLQTETFNQTCIYDSLNVKIFNQRIWYGSNYHGKRITKLTFHVLDLRQKEWWSSSAQCATALQIILMSQWLFLRYQLVWYQIFVFDFWRRRSFFRPLGTKPFFQYFRVFFYDQRSIFLVTRQWRIQTLS